MTNDRTPKEMREDASMWLRAGHSEVCAGRYKDAADQIERLTRERDHAEKLCESLQNRLAASPERNDGMIQSIPHGSDVEPWEKPE